MIQTKKLLFQRKQKWILFFLLAIFAGVVFSFTYIVNQQKSSNADAMVQAAAISWDTGAIHATNTYAVPRLAYDSDILTFAGFRSGANVPDYGVCDTSNDCTSSLNWSFHQIVAETGAPRGVVVDSSGNKYVIYTTFVGGATKFSTCLIVSGCDETADWSIYTIPGANTSNGASSFRIDANDNFHFTYVDSGNDVYYLNCLISSGCDEGTDWTSVLVFDNGAGFVGADLSMVLDSNNNPQVSFPYRVSAGNNTIVHSYCSTMTTTDCDLAADWASYQMIAVQANQSTNTEIAIDASNNLYLLFGETVSNDYKFMRCLSASGCDELADWTTPYSLDSGQAFTISIGLAVSGSVVQAVYSVNSPSNAFLSAQCDVNATSCDDVSDWDITTIDTGSAGSDAQLLTDGAGGYYTVYPHTTNSEIKLAVGIANIEVLSTAPLQNAIDVSRTSNLSIVFDQSLNTGTVSQANLPVYENGKRIDGAYSFATTSIVNDTVIFNPTVDFAYGAKVEFLIKDDVQSTIGASVNEYTSTFIVEAVEGDGSFLAQPTITTNTITVTNNSADLNNDGYLDLVSIGGAVLEVFLNNGDGTFAAGVQTVDITNARSLTLDDFNNDGFVDIATNHLTGSPTFSVFLNNGVGGFPARVDYATAGSGTGIDSGDLDGDGDFDLLVAIGSSVATYSNNGAGVFSLNQTIPLTSVQHLMVDDFNKDGKLDIVSTNDTDITVLLGVGDGTFLAGVDYTGTGAPFKVQTGDMNNDGNVDVVTSNLTGNTVSVFPGNGDGTFAARIDSVTDKPEGLDLGDIDADGDLDIISIDNQNSLAIALRNDGAGNLTVLDSYTVGNNPSGVSIGDFNNDGALDFAASGTNVSELNIYFGNIALAVNSITPDQNTINIDASTNIEIVFEQGLTTGTVTQANLPVFSLQRGLISGAYTFSTTTITNDTVTFNPAQDFFPGEVVQLSITDSVQSINGNSALASFFQFTVASGAPLTTFEPFVTVAASGQPTDVEVADIDLDGDIDIVASHGNAIPFNLGVYLNNGAGGFATPVLYASEDNPRFVTLGDLNNDGYPEVVLATQSSQTVNVYSNNGDGTYAAFVSYSTGGSTTGVDIADVDMDGDNDLIVAVATGQQNVQIFLNNGSGVFGAATLYPAVTTTNDVVVGDVDNDNDPDLVAVTVNAGNTASVYLNNGDGTYAAKVDYTATGSHGFVNLVDIHADSYLDIVTTSLFTNVITILINNGNGTFAAETTVATTGRPSSIADADFDNDGDLDLVIINDGNDNAEIFLNNGTGSYTFDQSYAVNASASNAAIETADFNGDGVIDIVTANQSATTISIILSTLPPQQGGGGSGSFNQQAYTPAVPTPQGGEAISSTSINWNFIDNATIEVGFRLIDENGVILKELNQANASVITEDNLIPNTLYSSRRLIALGQQANSAPSPIFEPIATLAPTVTPKFISVGTDSVTVGINEEFMNIDQGESGLFFELLSDESVVSTAIIESGWTKQTSYTFIGLTPGQPFQVRVKARNQNGRETPFSELTTPQDTPLQDITSFTLGLSGTLVGGGPIPSPMDPQSNIVITVQVANIGTLDATNVFVTVPVPQYLNYVPGSLMISGESQTDIPDTDIGQGNTNAVSAIWSAIPAGESEFIRFQFAFDQDALRMLKEQEEAQAQALYAFDGINRVRASANPIISVQASVNSEETETLASSSILSLVPDLTLLTEPTPVDPEPDTTTPPTPPPTTTPGGPNSFTPNPPVTTPDEGSAIGADKELVLTSQVDVSEDQLIFMGTTSEPNTIVLIKIASQEFETISDENGVWTLIVTSDQLGLSIGDMRQFNVETIAMKDGVSSNSVNQDVFLSRANEGQLLIEQNNFVDQNQLISRLKQTQVFAEENQDQVQAALAIATPLLIISSASLIGYLPFIPTLLFHGLAALFGITRRKKDKRFYGIVYDSITKQPIGLAIIRVYNTQTNKLVATQVTDKKGRYDLLIPHGSYRLEVARPGFIFPTKIVSGKSDGMYQELYQLQAPLIIGDELISPPDIPLDPIDRKRELVLASFFKKALLGLQKITHWFIIPLLVIGFIVSILLVTISPTNIVNWIYVAFYGLLVLLQLQLRPTIEKAWGVVYDLFSGAVLPLTTIQLIDPEYNKVVKSRLSDYQGRYSFLTHPGNYILKASHDGYDQIAHTEKQDPYHHPLDEQITISKENEHLNGDIPMKSKE